MKSVEDIPFDNFLKIKGFIFDCDGVLINSRTASSLYINEHLNVLRLGPLPLTEAKYDYLFELPLENILMELAPRVRTENIRSAMQKVHYDSYIPLLVPSIGMEDLLQLLKKNKFKLAIMTNRGSNFTSIADYFKFDTLFDSIMTTENVPPKPDPTGIESILHDWRITDNKAVIYIGDSKADLEAAQNAGVPFWSFNNSTLEAEVFVSCFPDLQRKICEFSNSESWLHRHRS
jgi:phosphoglycolate phosphatase